MKKYISLIILLFVSTLCAMEKQDIERGEESKKEKIRLTLEAAERSPILKKRIAILREPGHDIKGLSDDQILSSLQSLPLSNIAKKLLEGINLGKTERELTEIVEQANLNPQELKDLSETGTWLRLNFDKYIRLPQTEKKSPKSIRRRVRTLSLAKTSPKKIEAKRRASETLSTVESKRREARETFKLMEKMSPDQILDIPSNASYEDVLNAGRYLATIWDPKNNLDIDLEATAIHDLIMKAIYIKVLQLKAEGKVPRVIKK